MKLPKYTRSAKNREEIINCKRLFYQLNSEHFTSIEYKEITNPKEYGLKDNRLDDPEYIKYHNFQII